jgi:hypothetical protein
MRARTPENTRKELAEQAQIMESLKPFVKTKGGPAK